MGIQRVVTNKLDKIVMASMTPVPKVSVLMSCYDAARWLNEAIKSVLNQTFSDFEFIIIDDGSTDDTLNIIRRFAERDSRIHVVVKKNTGLSDSLNVGIDRAYGEWIARIDADDICMPDRLHKQLVYAQAHPKHVYIGSGLLEIDSNGHPLKIYGYPVRHTTLLNHLQTARKFPPHSSAFYRSTAVRAVGGYRSRIQRAQDWDLWLRLSEVGDLGSLKEPLVKIRKHALQISHEEGGRRQICDSTIGIISYFLRRYGYADPVNGEDGEFLTFKKWVDKKLLQSDYYEFCSAREGLKASVLKSDFYIAKILRACKALFSSSVARQMLKEKVIGSDLPRRLALEWKSEA